MPSFPSTDHLTRSSFIVTVSSTTAQRAPHGAPPATNDFVTNVSAYAPRTTPVTRVQLVDVDVPCTQRLIEEPWRNLYFGQGVYTSPDARTLNVTVPVEAAPGDCDPGEAALTTVGVVLPLLLDRVRTYTKLSDTSCTVRVVTTSRAPYPMDPIARAWRAMRSTGCGDLCLVGPAIGSLSLGPGQVYDDGPFSFVVQLPRSVYAALDPAGADVLYLYAAPMQGPGFLAAVATRTLTAVLGGVCPPWPQFALEYDPLADRYSLYAQAPHGLGAGLGPGQGAGGTGGGYGALPAAGMVPITLTGGLFAYMGFGHSFRTEINTRRASTVQAPGLRLTALGPPWCYGEVQCGTPPTPGVFVDWVTAALNTYTWPAGLTLGITVLGDAPLVVPLPSGQFTLPTLAEWLTAYLAGLGVNVAVSTPEGLTGTTCHGNNAAGSGGGCASGQGQSTGRGQGLVFLNTATPPELFRVDLTSLPPAVAQRLGYDPVVLGPAAQVLPTLPYVTHIPVLEGLCGPPRSGIQALLRSLDTDQMVFRSTPFAPMAASVVIHSDGTATVTLATPGVLHGLQVGACVALVDTAAPGLQITAYVIEVTGAASFDVVCATGLGPPPYPTFDGGPIQVTPLDAPPLDLYFGASVPALQALLPDVCGFQPQTYEGCGAICSPGTVSILQDPFVVVCLGFDGTEAEPLTGDVYYPLAAAPLVFAKVPRTNLFKSDFFKVYDHTFEGAGRTLGFVRVRILNPNGTLYQTHGHVVMVTLLFNTRQSMVGFGHGKATITFDGTTPPGYPDLSANRQVVPVSGGRGGVSLAM
jgi:hypothetical protein